MPYQSTWNSPYLAQPTYTQPSSYLPQQTQLPMQPQQAYQQPVNGIIKVNGPESALQYQLPPNSTSPALFDNNGKVFYVVSTDGTGTKSLEVRDHSPHVEQPVQIDGAQFVSKQEFDQFVAKVSAALEVINGSNGAVSASVPVSVPAAIPATDSGTGFEGKDGAAALNSTR